MQMTTKAIIQALPFEEQFKTDLLAQIDQFEGEQKYEITQVIWDTFFALYRYKFEDNLEQALEDVEKGKRDLGPNFYKEVEEQTEKEIEKELVSTAEKSGFN